MSKDEEREEILGTDTVRNDLEEQEILTKRMVNKKNKRKIIIGGILVVVAIAVGLFIGWKKINSNPLTVYKNAINDVYTKISKELDKIDDKNTLGIDLLNDSVVIKGDTTINSNIEALKKFIGISYNLDLGLNLKNEKVNLGLGINENDKKIINLLVTLMNKNAYVQCLELFDKVVDLGEFDLEEELGLKEMLNQYANANIKFDSKSFDYILKKTKNYLIESIDDKKLSMSNDKITIRDKEMRVKKVVYAIDEECALEMGKYIISHVLKDNKFISSLSNITEYKEGDIREKLEEILEELNNYKFDDNDKTVIDVVLYADKFNNVLAGALLIDNEEIIHGEIYDNLFSMTIASTGVEFRCFEEKDYVNISFREENVELVNIKVYKNDEAKIDFKANINGFEVNGGLEFTNIKAANNKASGDYKFSVNASLLGQKMALALEGSYSLEKAEFDPVKIKDSVSINDLSNDEIKTIYAKLESILERFGLKEKFGFGGV